MGGCATCWLKEPGLSAQGLMCGQPSALPRSFRETVRGIVKSIFFSGPSTESGTSGGGAPCAIFNRGQSDKKKPLIWVAVAGAAEAGLYQKDRDGAFRNITPPPRATPERTLGFADLGEWLDRSIDRNAFDRLVLVAAPGNLQTLRQAMSDRVNARVVAEIEQNLTLLGTAALSAALREIIWF